MRTPIFVAALGLSLAGCLVGDAGTPGTGGDDGTGSNPGNGSDPGSGSNPSPTPTVTATVDKLAVTTELGKTELITLTLTSGGSFAGDVTVTPSLVDSAGAALTGGITVTGQPTVSLAANGTATAMYTVTVPANATGTQLSAAVKFDVTSSAASTQATSALTVGAIYTMTYAAGLGADITAHPGRAQSITVKHGAKIQFHNADTAVHITHGEKDAPTAFPHETTGSTGGLPNNTYVIDTSNVAPGTTGKIGCHTHGSATYANIAVE